MHTASNHSRRGFIKTASVGTLAAISLPGIVSAALSNSSVKKNQLEKNDIVLFQGDSITDSGRSRGDMTTHTIGALGNGYAFLSAADLLSKYPDKTLKIFNRGISGDKVFQLANRWDNDCIGLNPNILSILIGVNDFWAIRKHGYTGTIETYLNDYTKLLDRTKNALPNLKLIIGEPFAVLDVKEVDKTWYPAFNDYRAKAKEVAKKFDATFIPYQRVFDEAVKLAPGAYWTIDGVHPSIAGARLMAHAWLDCVKG